MTHLSMEALLALRERRSEPGNAASWEHLQGCGACQSEMDGLHQRMAQLKALPTLRPVRDSWPTVAARVRADRWRRRSLQGAGLVGLAMAASLIMTVATNHTQRRAGAAVTVAQMDSIHKAQERSRELRRTLDTYQANGQVLDGRTATLLQEASDRLAKVDQALDEAEREQGQPQQVKLQLLKEHNDLLDMILSAQANPATHVEF